MIYQGPRCLETHPRSGVLLEGGTYPSRPMSRWGFELGLGECEAYLTIRVIAPRLQYLLLLQWS